MGSNVLVDWTKHRLDCQPKIGIFPVTRLDIEADLRSASFIIEADLKLADLTVTVAVTVTRGFKTAFLPHEAPQEVVNRLHGKTSQKVQTGHKICRGMIILRQKMPRRHLLTAACLSLYNVISFHEWLIAQIFLQFLLWITVLFYCSTFPIAFRFFEKNICNMQQSSLPKV